MRLLRLGALALATEIAHAYLDTSPFFMFSTSELLTSNSQLQPASTLTADISSALSQCPSSLYIIVSQRGVRASDYSQKSTPELSKWLARDPAELHYDSSRSSIAISDVVGEVDTQSWRNLLRSKCGAQDGDIIRYLRSVEGSEYRSIPRVFDLYLSGPEPENEMPETDMYFQDDIFANFMKQVDTTSYTVIWTTTPPATVKKAAEPELTDYEMASPLHQEAMHIDLKRDVGQRSLASRSSNQTIVDGDLFAKYQFLSPGLFMGFVVGLILLFILYVGVSALASLQVSYAAFDKDNGQLASKKQ